MTLFPNTHLETDLLALALAWLLMQVAELITTYLCLFMQVAFISMNKAPVQGTAVTSEK